MKIDLSKTLLGLLCAALLLIGLKHCTDHRWSETPQPVRSVSVHSRTVRDTTIDTIRLHPVQLSAPATSHYGPTVVLTTPGEASPSSSVRQRFSLLDSTLRLDTSAIGGSWAIAPDTIGIRYDLLTDSFWLSLKLSPRIQRVPHTLVAQDSVIHESVERGWLDDVLTVLEMIGALAIGLLIGRIF